MAANVLAGETSAPLEKFKVANWYAVQELRPDLYWISEPADAGFFVLRDKDQALFVDSGLGLSESLGKELLKALGLKKFQVLVTHAHCDHVGLNGLAAQVYIQSEEWKKFAANGDRDQVAKYYALMNEDPHPDWKWPSGMAVPPVQKEWAPTQFIRDGSKVRLGHWEVTAIESPGHTLGHMMYFAKKAGVLFLGDLVYSGTLYLNLPDSSLPAFDHSLSILENLMKEGPPELLLLPAHNSVPLPASYISRVRASLDAIKSRSLPPKSDWKKDSIFVDAKVFEKDFEATSKEKSSGLDIVKMAISDRDLKAAGVLK